MQFQNLFGDLISEATDRVWVDIAALGEKSKARDATLLAQARKRLKLTQKQAAVKFSSSGY
jgi:hypothetical protein